MLLYMYINVNSYFTVSFVIKMEILYLLVFSACFIYCKYNSNYKSLLDYLLHFYTNNIINRNYVEKI